MNVLRFLAAGIIVCMLTASARTDDKKENPDQAKLIVGKWDVIRSSSMRGLPVGSTIEFSKDGKMKITLRGSKQIIEETSNAVYKVKADMIEYTMKPDPKREEDPREVTIKKLSQQELVLEFDKDHPLEFERADDKQEESPPCQADRRQMGVTRGTKDVPAGTTIEFSKDGKMKSTVREWNGMEETGNAHY
jgi:uncharacterized protein (TIGR03066 family)